ncbi:secondary thiamine-phosphate synthase enzyme [Hypnocyclicus thermotrophus]|uniref:Secondary thiamine-phosphate synthase enzyme n=1 Tax=Hypnocyclicus thermotrophus TaxID=1627895 RepID=A0AA46E0M5_9FUSO|nr:secondary thiamine-phosphate synthase enzyme YjbQ [Hypnocyclicus thermotrophus]TDT72313.1 secondary thiamine-phosphate synthase enzyme [Hypnocyclicus thermotrophus]
MFEIIIHTSKRNEMIDISSKVYKLIKENNLQNGILYLHVMHTTAAITINENADNDVKIDLINALNSLVPNIKFYHYEGNSDAHLKTSLIGNSVNILIENGNPILGTWQGIYFCEFDGPRKRKVVAKFIKE